MGTDLFATERPWLQFSEGTLPYLHVGHLQLKFSTNHEVGGLIPKPYCQHVRVSLSKKPNYS